MSYVDKVISNVWQIVGGTCAIIALLALNYGNNIAILPLLLLVLSVGAGITGSVIQEKSFYNCSAFGIAISLGMLFNRTESVTPFRTSPGGDVVAYFC